MNNSQRFLGILTYFSHFLRNFSFHNDYLRQILKKDMIGNSQLSNSMSFDKLKALLSQSRVLYMFDANKSVVIQVDASSFGLGECLLQDTYQWLMYFIRYILLNIIMHKLKKNYFMRFLCVLSFTNLFMVKNLLCNLIISPCRQL